MAVMEVVPADPSFVDGLVAMRVAKLVHQLWLRRSAEEDDGRDDAAVVVVDGLMDQLVANESETVDEQVAHTILRMHDEDAAVDATVEVQVQHLYAAAVIDTAAPTVSSAASVVDSSLVQGCL